MWFFLTRIERPIETELHYQRSFFGLDRAEAFWQGSSANFNLFEGLANNT